MRGRRHPHRCRFRPCRGAVLAAAVVLPAAWAVAAGCGKDEGGDLRIGSTPVATPGSAAVATERAIDQATGRVAPAPEGGGGGPAAPIDDRQVRAVEISPDLFIPSDDNRDPFDEFEIERMQAAVEPVEAVPVVQVSVAEDVLFPDRDIKDLQCRMILSMEGEKPRAYLLAPDGKAGYVRENEYVGRPLYAGLPRAEVYWRVYEVMEGGVSFEASVTRAREGDTEYREVRRLYTDQEMARFTDLFSMQ